MPPFNDSGFSASSGAGHQQLINGFPPARFSGPTEQPFLAPPQHWLSSVPDRWSTYYFPETYRVARRPQGVRELPRFTRIEITPKGNAAREFADNAISDLFTDIEEFAQVRTDDDDEPYFIQSFLLRKTKTNLLVARRYEQDRPRSIGAVPPEIASEILRACPNLASIHVEVVEARISDNDDPPKVRYSVCLSVQE